MKLSIAPNEAGGLGFLRGESVWCPRNMLQEWDVDLATEMRRDKPAATRAEMWRSGSVRWRTPPLARVWRCVRKKRGYCLSYTETLVTSLPALFFDFMVTVRVLPSAEITMRPEATALPSFLLVSSKVVALMRL